MIPDHDGNLAQRPWINGADLVLIGLLLGASVAGWFWGSRRGEDPDAWQCRIRVFAKPPSERLLTVIPEGSQQVRGLLGTSTLEWDRLGRVRFVSSPCPNQVCVHTGWTAAPQTVVCVPNGILVEFPARSSERLDGITR